MQAAGPVFLAAADFHEQISAGLIASDNQVLRFMTVLVSIMIPYSKGYRYRQVYGGDF